MTSEVHIENKDNHVQQKIFENESSWEQYWILVEKKFRYPLPRHSFKLTELSLKNNAHENIGTKKFSVAMNLANTWENRINEKHN